MTAAAAFVDALVAALQSVSTSPPIIPPVTPPVIPPVTPPVVPPIVPPVVPVAGHPKIMASQAPRLKLLLGTGSAPAVRWRQACDRWLAGEDLWGFGAPNGALLYMLTGDAKYGIKAVAMIEGQVAAAEAKIASRSAPAVAADSYLDVGPMIGDLALVFDWCAPLVTGPQKARWIAYANQAVLNVWNPKGAVWGGRLFPWTGWAVDDPSNNYFYSFLRATMLLGLATTSENPRAAEWVAKFRERIQLLVMAFSADLVGGGSREGTGYGVAMRNLFELYALWQWTTGENLAGKTTHTRDSILTMLGEIVPTLDRKAPVGDQSRDSTAALFDYERAYLLILMALYPLEPESARAASVLAASSVPQMQSSFMLMYDFIYAPVMSAVASDLPLVRYAPGIGQIFARSSWSNTATWLNVIAGPFTQSHAHEDQGSIMLFKGDWLAADAVLWNHGGVRQSGSIVGTTYAHSLVRIDAGGEPIPQRESQVAGTVLALHSGPGYVFTCVDTTKAYGGNALITLVRRQVLWLKPDVVIIQDRVTTGPGTVQIWQLIIPNQPSISGAAATVTVGSHTLKATRLQPASGTWAGVALGGGDQEAGWRLEGRQPAGAMTYVIALAGGGDQEAGWRLEGRQPAGAMTYVIALAIDGAAVPPGISFSDVGCSFTLDGKAIALGAGIDL